MRGLSFERPQGRHSFQPCRNSAKPLVPIYERSELPHFHRNYLLTSGVILAFGGLVHLAAIFGGPDWYAFLGAPAGLVALADTDSLRPAISCVVIALMLFACAAYACSGAGVIRKLPALRGALALIGLGLVARGLLFVPLAAWRPHVLSGLCGKCEEAGLFLVATSSLCLFVGGGYLFGAMRARHR